ncbi:hypothetical protein LINGRAHAP2_LOCUS7215 [Linum grandiflorum]
MTSSKSDFPTRLCSQKSVGEGEEVRVSRSIQFVRTPNTTIEKNHSARRANRCSSSRRAEADRPCSPVEIEPYKAGDDLYGRNQL